MVNYKFYGIYSICAAGLLSILAVAYFTELLYDPLWSALSAGMFYLIPAILFGILGLILLFKNRRS